MTTIKLSETKEIRIHEQDGVFQGFYGHVYDNEFQILQTSPSYSTERGLKNWINKIK